MVRVDLITQSLSEINDCLITQLNFSISDLASNADMNQLTRFKSFKKSLRKTFRRKKRTGKKEEREENQQKSVTESFQQFTMENCDKAFMEREIIARDINKTGNFREILNTLLK